MKVFKREVKTSSLTQGKKENPVVRWVGQDPCPDTRPKQEGMRILGWGYRGKQGPELGVVQMGKPPVVL